MGKSEGWLDLLLQLRSQLICASMQATRFQWNSEESLFNSYLLQLPILATCPAAQVLSP
jgi:hypothetical protein